MQAGIDVGSDSVMVCWSEDRPAIPREFYRQSPNFKHVRIGDIEELLSMNLRRVFLEPTGSHYSRLWIRVLERSGCEVLLIGHRELLSYRQFLGLPDKDDKADALALLCYGIDFLPSQKRFLHPLDTDCRDLRYFYYRLKHYGKIRGSLSNRLKQDLIWQMPEVASARIVRSSDKPPLLIRWLSGEEESSKYEKILAKSVGEGLGDDSCFTAELIYDLFNQEILIEKSIKQILEKEKFSDYLEILKEFKLDGLKTAAFLISQIYPFSQFLGEDNTPIIEKVRTDGGKLATHRISENRFKAKLACAPTRDFSGKSQKFKKRGSAEIRVLLWQWHFRTIEKMTSRPDSEVGRKMGEYWDKGRASGVPVKKLRARSRSKAMILLFRQFCKKPL